METLTELLDTIKLGITERIASPLLGTYIISWIIFNYRFFMIIFGSGTTDGKFMMLDDQVYGGFWHWRLAYTFLWPAIITCAYIFLYPKMAKPVYEMRLENLRELSAIKRKIEDETPLTVEASRRLRVEMLDFRQKLAKQESESEQAITDLQKTLAQERASRNSIIESSKQEQHQKDKEPLSENIETLREYVALGFVATAYGNGFGDMNTALTWLRTTIPSTSEVGARTILDSLKDRNLLTYDRFATKIQLSPSGRSFVVQHGLDNQEEVNKIRQKVKEYRAD